MQRIFLYLIVLVIVVVVAVVLFFGTGILNHSSSGLAAYDNVAVPASLLAQLNISNNVANNVGIGTANYKGIVKNVSGAPALTLNGKPEVLYMGAEYCPFCAADRWALIIALSRFGTFNGIDYMTSSATDYSPSTPTFTFYNATYTSNYITFVPVEMQSNKEVNGTYPVLVTPTAQEDALIATYDPGGSIPFINFANSSVIVGASYDPGTIDAENWTTIAGKLGNPSSLEAMEIVGTANLMTAQICKATGGQPQSVCGQPYVTAVNNVVG